MSPQNSHHIQQLSIYLSNYLNDLFDHFMLVQGYQQGFAMEQFLSQFPVADLTNWFTVFSECECCDRHQQRRPDVLGPCPDYPHRHGEEHQEGACQCSCRHFSRWICRASQIAHAEQDEQDEHAEQDEQDEQA